MKLEERLRVSAMHTAAIAAAALVLWASELGFRALLWPVLFAALISMAICLLFWAQGRGRLRRALKLPEAFPVRVGQALRMAVRLLRAGAWLAILVSGGLFLAGTQSDPGDYYGLIGGLIGMSVLAAMVRAASVPFPLAGQVFPVPWVHLMAFLVVYMFLHADWLTEHGFPNGQLLFSLWSALTMSYAGATLIKVSRVMEEPGRRSRWVPPPAVLRWAGALMLGTSLGLIVWGALSSLPNVTALLLNRWPHLLVGYATQPYFRQFYEARYLIGVFVAGLYAAAKLPMGANVSEDVDYMPLSKAVGYTVVGAVAWLAGAEMAELGHGSPLVGASVACGLFAAGLSHMARYHTSSPVWAVSAASRLLAKSVYRTALLGVFLAFYGLLVRPLIYDVMLLAPLYEWFTVVLFAAVAINRMRRHAKEQVAPEGTPPAEWLDWSRHVQTVEDRQDPRLGGLVDLQTRYVDTGRWAHLWKYMLGLLLRNGTPIQVVPEVFEPIRRNFDSSAEWDPRPGRRAWAERRRASALAESISRLDAALAQEPEPLPVMDKETVTAVGRRFVESGASPEVTAVTFVAAYWQRGAPLDLAVGLWFPLLTMAHNTRRGPLSLFSYKESSERQLEWSRSRIVEAAVAHLCGSGTAGELPLAVLAAPAPVQDRSGRRSGAHIGGGTAIEVLAQEGALWEVRAGDDQRSSITPAGAPRLRILPGD